MTEHTIDTLELEIESNANDAGKALDKLAKTLAEIKISLNGISFKNMQNFAKNADKISKSFSGMLKTVNSVDKKLKSTQGIKIPVKANTEDIENIIDNLQKRFREAGADFSFTGNSVQLEKEIAKTEKSLERLYSKQDEAVDLNDFGSKAFIRLQRNIAATVNKLDILREKFAENKKAVEEMAKNITITRFDADIGESVYEPPKEVEVSEKSLGFDPGAMRAVFGEGADQIRDFSDAVQKFGNLAGITLNGLESGIAKVGGSAKSVAAKVTNAAKSLKDGLQSSGLDAGKLEEGLKDIKIPSIDASGLDGVQSELSQTESKLQSLISKIRDMASAGKINIGGAGFEGFKKSIDSITAKADSLKKKMADALKLRFDIGKWSKFLNISTLINKLFSKIKSGAKGTAASVKRIGEAFSSLHSAVKRVEKMIGAVFRNMAGLASRAAKVITNSAKGIANAFSKITSSSKGAEKAAFSIKGLIKAAAGLVAAKGISSFGENSISIASDMTEAGGRVNAVFGKMADSANKFAETATGKFGLSELAAKQYSSTMMAMMKSSGMAQAEAAKMATTLTGLAGDMAAFYGIESDDAFSKLQSAMSGETEALRNLGINMSTANLQAYALSQGIRKSYGEMSVAEQTMLRYNYILERTAGIQGSAARTCSGYAGQMRILRANLQSLSGIIGQGLIAALLPAIKVLNKFMEKLIQAAKVFRDFMYVLTGQKIKGSAKGVVNDFAGIGDQVDLSSISNESGDVADNMEDAADGMDDATSSAKKLKKSLSVLPIDELNQLAGAMEDLSTSSGGKKKGTGLADKALKLDDAGLGDMGNLFDGLENPDITPINKWAKAIRDAFLKHDWGGVGKNVALMLNAGLKKIYTGIKNITPKVVQAMKNLAEGVNGFIHFFKWELLGKTIGAGIALIVKAFNGLFDAKTGIDFAGLGKGLAKGVRGLVNEIPWIEVGNAVGNGAMIVINLFSGFMEQMMEAGKEGVTGFGEIGIALAEAVEGIFQKIDFGVLGTALSNLFNGITDTIENFNKTMKENETWQKIADNISNGLTNAIKGIKPVEAAQAIGQLMTDLLDTMLKIAEKTPWYTLGEKIGDFLINIPWGRIISDVFDIIWTVFSGLITGLASKIFNKMPEIFTAMASGFNLIVSKLDSFIQGIEWSEIGDTIARCLNNMLLGINWEGLGTLLSDSVKALLDVIGATIEGINWQELGEKLFDFLAAIDWTGIVERLAEVIGAAFGGFAALLWGFIKQSWQSVIDWWKDKAFEDGKFTIQGLLDGILEIISDIGSWIYDHITKPFVDGFRKTFGIHSPSTVMAELGGFVIEGLLVGLKEKISDVLTWFSELPGKIKAKFGNAKEWLKGKGSDLMDGLRKGFDGKWKDFSSSLKGLGDKIKKGLPNLFDIGKKAMKGLADGLKAVKLTLPHVNVSWTEHMFGDKKFKLPSFDLKWCAKGGLALHPSIVGIAEAGKEAILPLENPRTMRTIAESIAAEAPAAGIDEALLANAVARGVAMAMMNNPQAQTSPEYIQNSIYLDGSVLARVLSKAQREIDYRVNPTPQFG